METEAGKNFTVSVIQQKPYTCVTVETAGGDQYLGFSKVVYPDKWSAWTGMKFALGHAMADMLGIQPPKGKKIEVYAPQDQLLGVEEEAEAELPRVRLHIPDHRTMEEKARDEKNAWLKDAYVREKAAKKALYAVNARRIDLIEEIERAQADMDGAGELLY